MIQDSCLGPQVCDGLAQNGGNVTEIVNSCIGFKSCIYVAEGKGTVASLLYSCEGGLACQALASDTPISSAQPGAVSVLNGSCNANYACVEYRQGNSSEPLPSLTCIKNPSNDEPSPSIDRCVDSDGGIGMCDGSGPFCTTAPSAMPSTIPTSSPSSAPSAEPSSLPSSSPSCPVGNEVYHPSNYWVPPLDKPGMACDNVRLKIPDQGEFSCIPIGEGICRDNGGSFGEWRFGIEEVETQPCLLFGDCPVSVSETDTFPVLIDPALTRYPITGTSFTDGETGKVCKNGYGEAIRGCNYAGTTHICISENIEADPNRYSNERPYMFFYDEKKHQYLYQLVCDGIGEEGKLPELKMVNQEGLADATYVDYPVDLVKFKKGATPNKDDSNELWKMYMDWNGFEDPDTRRVGKLASFIGVAHPKLCKEYVSATDKACWKEECDDVATPEAYELDNCELQEGRGGLLLNNPWDDPFVLNAYVSF